MSVLIATPVKLDIKPAFMEVADALARRLTYRDAERIVFRNCIDLPEGGKYWRNAAARNMLIDFHLRPVHEWVMWIDADLADYPPDLIERLLELGSAQAEPVPGHFEKVLGVTAAAPFVLIEGRDQFYDYGGFIRNGQNFSPAPPYTDATGVMSLDSCGTCYLVPAHYYRQGCRYHPLGDEVEHVSFFRDARRLGCTIRADSGLIVRHMDLPRRGEAWH